MTKMENEIVSPALPTFYKRYVDDIYVRRTKDANDNLFDSLNNYHDNIKFTIEEHPKRFLDTEILTNVDNIIETKVFRKPNSFPAHWSSKTPKRYKRNSINTDLHRAKRISSDFNAEIGIIRRKFISAGYPHKFIESVVRHFLKEEEEEIIPYWLFDDRIFIPIYIQFSPENESFTKRFLEKLCTFTNNKFKFCIIWQTRSVKSLFSLKDKVEHQSNIIYYGVCSCNEEYYGESDRNATIRWNEHNKPNHDFRPAQHIKNNIDHCFTWKVVRGASPKKSKRKILEAFFIMKFKPSINNQLDIRNLILFKNGI